MTELLPIRPYRLSLAAFVAVLWIAALGFGAETFPPAPSQYFNDFANVTRPQTREDLNRRLDEFERQTSDQVVVAVFPKLDSQRPYDDYSIRLFNAWKIGRNDNDNGVGLFVYIAEHKAFICTGKGLEGPLPDATCYAIVQNDIVPRFKAGDYDGGLTAGVNSIMAAVKGEYQGNGSTVADQQHHGDGGIPIGVFLAIFVAIIVLRSIFGGYTTYGRYGRSGGYWGGGFGGFGGGFGGGGGGGFGGGGFSGGGGSSGGGGAGGSW